MRASYFGKLSMTVFACSSAMKTLIYRLAGPLTLLWVAVMLVLTLTPAKEMPRTPAWKLLSFDTAAHAGVFAVLAGLAWLWARPRRRHPASLVLLGCIGFGALIEVLQYVMQLGRHAEWTDLLSDSIGAALGLAFVGMAGRSLPHATLALLLFLLPSSPICAQPTEPDMARARRTVEALASPKMHGRGYVQQGEHKAAAYLRDRLRQLGLAPLAPNYTQSFSLDVNTFPGNLKLELSTYAKLNLLGQTWQPGTDYIAAPSSGAGVVYGAKVLLFDSLAFSNPEAVSQLLKEPIQSRTLVLNHRDEARLATLPTPLRTHLDSAALWITLVPKLTASLASTQAPQPRLELLTSRWAVASDNSKVHVLRANCEVDAQLLRSYPTQNLAAIVRGRVRPDSFLIVSAHYDHLGTMGRKTYFPGANDNASGVALLLELAAHYARPENRPACSLVFLLFGAEEAGLVGSSYFVQHPLVPLTSIKFLLNLDLLGTGEEGATVVNGRVHEAAFARLAALNDARHYLPRLTARGRAANSDHFPFSEAGVPAFFLYTRGGSLAYHDVNDRPAALSLAGFAGAYGLARDFLDGLGARALAPAN
jgi:aminopeptidase YwaD